MAGTKADLILVGQRTVRVVSLGPQTGLRELRSTLLEVMLWLDQHTDIHATVTVAVGRLLEKRIVAEIDAVRRITAPAIFQRMHACVLPHPPADPCAGLEPWLRTPEMAEAIRRNRWTQHGPARPAFPQVLMVLVQDLLGGVPVRTRHELECITDLSYPAIARALTEIGSLVDDGYRALRLRDFPRDAWDRMLANRSAWRRGQPYCVATGLPFKPERVIRQIRELNKPDLAFGGVIGARAYRPIDLIGVPRLDISMHAPVGMMDLSWVAEVAPDLRPCLAGESPHLVVHAVRRAKSLFHQAVDGNMADRAEVLLDLQDLRLDEQAAAFIHDALAERTHG
jgi:hypothetical protein